MLGGRPRRSWGTHIAQIQELRLVGQAEEGGADDEVNLWEGHRSAPGWGQGALWARVPSTAAPAPLTCRVGSRAASWESCSLKALSFSSYWLGEGQAASFPRGGRLTAPGTSGWGNAVAPPALCALPCHPPCALNLLAFLTRRTPGCFAPQGGAGPVQSQAVSQVCGRRPGGRDGEPAHLCTARSNTAFLSASLSWEGQSATDWACPAPPPPSALPLPWASATHWLSAQPAGPAA